MAEKQYPATVKDFRQNSKVLEIKKEGKDCVSLDRKLMYEKGLYWKKNVKGVSKQSIKECS